MLRRTLFTVRYAAPVTESFVFPVNGTPPADFTPSSIADLMPQAVFDSIEVWMAENFGYLLQCARAGVQPARGRVSTLVITQDMLFPQARGVVWKCTPAGLTPADFAELPFVQLRTAFLAEALADYPDRQLVSFLVFGSSTQSEATGKCSLSTTLPFFSVFRLAAGKH
jgi:hypothetical protein